MISATVNSSPANHSFSTSRASMSASTLFESLNHAHGHRAGCVETGDLHRDQRGWLQIAVREMKPIEIVRVIFVSGRERELPVAVLVDDVLGAGG